jgi:hypothetical protein
MALSCRPWWSLRFSTYRLWSLPLPVIWLSYFDLRYKDVHHSVMDFANKVALPFSNWPSAPRRRDLDSKMAAPRVGPLDLVVTDLHPLGEEEMGWSGADFAKIRIWKTRRQHLDKAALLLCCSSRRDCQSVRLYLLRLSKSKVPADGLRNVVAFCRQLIGFSSPGAAKRQEKGQSSHLPVNG